MEVEPVNRVDEVELDKEDLIVPGVPGDPGLSRVSCSESSDLGDSNSELLSKKGSEFGMGDISEL